MSTKIKADLLDEPTRAFLEQHDALGGYFSVSRGDGTRPIEAILSNGRDMVELPPAVRGALILAASRTDGVLSAVYEFASGSAARDSSVEPVRSQFPDTPDGGRQFARAYGLWAAQNRDAHERKGLPPDGQKIMTRAEFDELDPLAKRQALREKVRLVDQAG